MRGLLVAIGLTLLLSPWPASAQRIRPGEERPELKEFLPEEEPEAPLALPAIPVPPKEERDRISTGARILVKEFRIVGSTVFPDEELAEVVASYTNRELSTEDLIEARDAITRHYISRGYVSSGAVLPDQRVQDGVVEIQVVEGTLAEISIEGTTHFRPSYLRRRLELATRGPVNIKDLEERLQLLQQDPRIARLQAQLGPGELRGENVLGIVVEEESPYRLSFQGSNEESPGIGSARGEIRGRHENLTGNGDILETYYAGTEGLDEWDIRYSIPVNAHDTTLELRYRNSDSEVVESPFDDLDIEAESTTYGISLKHPFYRTPRSELWLGLTGDLRRSETNLLSQGFGFPGSGADPDGDTHASILRLFQEWTTRSRSYVVSARSTFSFGLDLFDATNYDPPGESPAQDPDSTFFTWLGQFQWAYRLPEQYRGTQLVFRTDVQLSANPLFSMEKFAVGGSRTVRGYVENQLVSDNGVVSSIEFRIPILRDPLGQDIIQLAPFADFGHSWNHDETAGPKTIASLGVGLRWWLSEGIFVTGYWGGKLRKVERRTNDIQQNGFHLRAVVTAF